MQITLQKKKAIKDYNYTEAENCDILIKEIKRLERDTKKREIIETYRKEIDDILNRSKKLKISFQRSKKISEEHLKFLDSYILVKLLSFSGLRFHLLNRGLGHALEGPCWGLSFIFLGHPRKAGSVFCGERLVYDLRKVIFHLQDIDSSIIK